MGPGAFGTDSVLSDHQKGGKRKGRHFKTPAFSLVRSESVLDAHYDSIQICEDPFVTMKLLFAQNDIDRSLIVGDDPYRFDMLHEEREVSETIQLAL
jgi:hypothetical protein